jgi:hypothetical protein
LIEVRVVSREEKRRKGGGSPVAHDVHHVLQERSVACRAKQRKPQQER